MTIIARYFNYNGSKFNFDYRIAILQSYTQTEILLKENLA